MNRDPEIQYKTIPANIEQIWTWHKKRKYACLETSTKVKADRLLRGRPESGGVLRSVVDIQIEIDVRESDADQILLVV